jgi:hypothetical protein
MPCPAMILSSDSQNPTAYAPSERPPLTITAAGRRVLVPTFDELLKRRGCKGLQLTLDELTHHHFMVHGHDWLYAGGAIKAHSTLYFVHFTGDVHYLGKHRQALDYLIAYAKTGKPNHAQRRMR